MSAEWLTNIQSEFGDKILRVRENVPGEFEITVKEGSHRDLLLKMKADAGGAFVFLSDLTGYDEHPKTPRYYVIYNLTSMKLKCRASVVVPAASDDKPQVATVTDIWSGANWLERETFDMFGIEFTQHPDQRRILLPESFVGHPLRKDFLVDYRQKFADQPQGEETFDPFGNNFVTQTSPKEP